MFFQHFHFSALFVRICIKIAYISECTPRSSRKHILANRCFIVFNKNPIFLVGCTSECLLAASGLQSRFAKYVVNICIICTWARLEAPLNLLMLQISWFLFLFIFRPFISLEFSTRSNFNPSFFCKYAPRLGRKHNSRDRHTPTWTLKIASSARSCALLQASWHRFSGFDPPSRQGLIAKNIGKLCVIFTIFFFATCFSSFGR